MKTIVLFVSWLAFSTTALAGADDPDLLACAEKIKDNPYVGKGELIPITNGLIKLDLRNDRIEYYGVARTGLILDLKGGTCSPAKSPVESRESILAKKIVGAAARFRQRYAGPRTQIVEGGSGLFDTSSLQVNWTKEQYEREKQALAEGLRACAPLIDEATKELGDLVGANSTGHGASGSIGETHR